VPFCEGAEGSTIHLEQQVYMPAATGAKTAFVVWRQLLFPVSDNYSSLRATITLFS